MPGLGYPFILLLSASLCGGLAAPMSWADGEKAKKKPAQTVRKKSSTRAARSRQITHSKKPGTTKRGPTQKKKKPRRKTKLTPEEKAARVKALARATGGFAKPVPTKIGQRSTVALLSQAGGLAIVPDHAKKPLRVNGKLELRLEEKPPTTIVLTNLFRSQHNERVPEGQSVGYFTRGSRNAYEDHPLFTGATHTGITLGKPLENQRWGLIPPTPGATHAVIYFLPISETDLVLVTIEPANTGENHWSVTGALAAITDGDYARPPGAVDRVYVSARTHESGDSRNNFIFLREREKAVSALRLALTAEGTLMEATTTAYALPDLPFQLEGETIGLTDTLELHPDHRFRETVSFSPKNYKKELFSLRLDGSYHEIEEEKKKSKPRSWDTVPRWIAGMDAIESYSGRLMGGETTHRVGQGIRSQMERYMGAVASKERTAARKEGRVSINPFFLTGAKIFFGLDEGARASLVAETIHTARSVLGHDNPHSFLSLQAPPHTNPKETEKIIHQAVQHARGGSEADSPSERRFIVILDLFPLAEDPNRERHIIQHLEGIAGQVGILELIVLGTPELNKMVQKWLEYHDYYAPKKDAGAQFALNYLLPVDTKRQIIAQAVIDSGLKVSIEMLVEAQRLIDDQVTSGTPAAEATADPESLPTALGSAVHLARTGQPGEAPVPLSAQSIADTFLIACGESSRSTFPPQARSRVLGIPQGLSSSSPQQVSDLAMDGMDIHMERFADQVAGWMGFTHQVFGSIPFTLLGKPSSGKSHFMDAVAAYTGAEYIRLELTEEGDYTDKARTAIKKLRDSLNPIKILAFDEIHKWPGFPALVTAMYGNEGKKADPSLDPAGIIVLFGGNIEPDSPHIATASRHQSSRDETFTRAMKSLFIGAFPKTDPKTIDAVASRLLTGMMLFERIEDGNEAEQDETIRRWIVKFIEEPSQIRRRFILEESAKRVLRVAFNAAAPGGYRAQQKEVVSALGQAIAEADPGAGKFLVKAVDVDGQVSRLQVVSIDADVAGTKAFFEDTYGRAVGLLRSALQFGITYLERIRSRAHGHGAATNAATGLTIAEAFLKGFRAGSSLPLFDIKEEGAARAQILAELAENGLKSARNEGARLVVPRSVGIDQTIEIANVLKAPLTWLLETIMESAGSGTRLTGSELGELNLRVLGIFQTLKLWGDDPENQEFRDWIARLTRSGESQATIHRAEMLLGKRLDLLESISLAWRKKDQQEQAKAHTKRDSNLATAQFVLDMHVAIDAFARENGAEGEEIAIKAREFVLAVMGDPAGTHEALMADRREYEEDMQARGDSKIAAGASAPQKLDIKQAEIAFAAGMVLDDLVRSIVDDFVQLAGERARREGTARLLSDSVTGTAGPCESYVSPESLSNSDVYREVQRILQSGGRTESYRRGGP